MENLRRQKVILKLSDLYKFITDVAAAEVLVRGCCSNLNQTKHHLVSPWPPPLLTTSDIKAEFLSPVQKSGQVTSRILFCNTRGCNRRGVPWSSLKAATAAKEGEHISMSILPSTHGKDTLVKGKPTFLTQ